ncbi:MAG: glycosyltransferase family 4 protein [Syntrophaceticus sp.]|nr:glycosyltransferase family 4 protein [Syntrophaceticus sp.]
MINLNFINVSTYSPRQCGLASFSKDLRGSLVKDGHKVSIAAISDKDYAYPPEVYCEIKQNTKEDYCQAAYKINNSPQIQMVIIQHEYGIFGGPDGNFVFDFVAHLDKPFLLVTHTVLPHPTAGQRVILQILARQAAAVVCMTGRSARLLNSIYGVSMDKVAIIPHGVPPFERKDREGLKMLYGYTGRKLIATFGLIGPSKGLEIGIKAVERLVDRHPDVLYLIAGKTHPVLLEKEGESYRQSLIEMCADRGLDKHVQFINHFLEVEELGDLLYMTDVYLCPYPNRDQAVSGTLAYAVGCGRAIVSTPFEYALDLLKKHKLGLVVPEASSEAISKYLDQVLSRQTLKKSLEKKASAYGETISWPGVAARYADLAIEVRRSRELGRVVNEKVMGDSLASVAKRQGIWR